MSSLDERDTVSPDAIFDVLADRRRRHVISYLEATDDDVASRGELASHVCSRDPDAASEERVAFVLHHAVLPRLEDAGLIEYDARSATVRYRRAPELVSLLDGITE